MKTLPYLLMFALCVPLAAQEKKKDPEKKATKKEPPKLELGKIMKRTYDFTLAKKEMEYRLFVPKGYDKKKKYPLIVALHGLGASPSMMMRYPGFTSLAQKYGYIVVAPMGYNRRGWYGSRGQRSFRSRPRNLGELSEKDVMNVLAIIRRDFNIDPERTYLMGHSMGGGGTWHIGMKYSSIWAALGPIAPAIYRSTKGLEKIRHMPVIVVQGDKDRLVNVRIARHWVEKMKQLKMIHQYIEVKGGGHVRPAFTELPKIFAFFNKHKRRKPESEADYPPLWILSGQSNACGRAKLPGPKPNPAVTMYDPMMKKFVVAQDPLPHMGTRGTGPWVAAAQTVTTSTKAPIKMVGFASGGKPISFWGPGQPGYKGLFPVVESSGQRATVFLWYQGESDGGGKLSRREYESRLKAHVERVRSAASNPRMLVVIVQLGPQLHKGRGGYMAIREAQRQFVINDDNAILVPALGRTLKDRVHLDNAGYRELGREIGRAVLRTRYESNQAAWPGPVLDDAVLQPAKRNRNVVLAHFAEAKELIGVHTADFAVLDAEGTNLAVSVTKVGKTLVQVELERDVTAPAKLVYGFGQRPKASLTDESNNRAPAVQLLIRKGDAPKDEATKMANGAGKTK